MNTEAVLARYDQVPVGERGDGTYLLLRRDDLRHWLEEGFAVESYTMGRPFYSLPCRHQHTHWVVPTHLKPRFTTTPAWLPAQATTQPPPNPAVQWARRFAFTMRDYCRTCRRVVERCFESDGSCTGGGHCLECYDDNFFDGFLVAENHVVPMLAGDRP